MDYLEKILFIDITSHQYGKSPSDHPEYVETLQKLSESERNQYGELSAEVHKIWSHINMPTIVPMKNRVNSIFEYNESVRPINQRLLNFCKDYEISLKDEPSERFKAVAKKILGTDYSGWFET